MSTFAADYLPNPNISSQLGITTAGLSSPQEQAIDLTSGQAQPAQSIFNASVPQLMNMIAGNFPGLSATTGDMTSSLFNALWGAAQPGLEQGQQAINAQATGYGQAAASSPAQAEVGNLYQGTLENLLSQVMGAGVQQYNTDLGLTNAATQLGLQMPGVVSGQLMQTGGLEQNVAQSALNNLYQIYGQQMGLSAQDMQAMLGLGTGGIQLPNEMPQQYSPSGLQNILGSVAGLIPGLSGLSGLSGLFSGLFGSNTPNYSEPVGPTYTDLTTADRTSPFIM